MNTTIATIVGAMSLAQVEAQQPDFSKQSLNRANLPLVKSILLDPMAPIELGLTVKRNSSEAQDSSHVTGASYQYLNNLLDVVTKHLPDQVKQDGCNANSESELANCQLIDAIRGLRSIAQNGRSISSVEDNPARPMGPQSMYIPTEAVLRKELKLIAQQEKPEESSKWATDWVPDLTKDFELGGYNYGPTPQRWVALAKLKTVGSMLEEVQKNKQPATDAPPSQELMPHEKTNLKQRLDAVKSKILEFEPASPSTTS